MTHFGQTLINALRSTGMSQIGLAQASELTSPQISRYIRGETHPEFKSASRIIEQFDDYHRALLVSAYMRDLIPSTACHLVRFSVEGFTLPLPAATPQQKKKLPPEFRDALEYLQIQGLASDSVRGAVVAFVRALCGRVDPI